MFKRIVMIVELVALVSFGVFVLLLFIHQPESSSAKSTTASSSSGPVDGAAIYADNCAGCHGKKGQGGVGPELANGEAVKNFPNAADELAVVAKGKGGMPSFGTRLNQEELAAVVQYTRNGF